MEKEGTQSDFETAIGLAVAKALRPFVRLLVARSLRFPLAAELLKRLYVDVAVREFPVAGKPQTDSRINLLTGVHRKDVRRLRHEDQARLDSPRQASLSTQLIARWTTVPAYLGNDGAPLPLPRSGPAPSFDALVRDLNTDIRPRVVLDEWQRLGLVENDAEDRVCLKVDAFVPPEGTNEIAYYFGRNVHDHAAAAVHNVLGGRPPMFERSVNYNNLTPESVADLSQLARQRGMALLQELNARALQLQERDSEKPAATQRLNCGIYLFAEDEAEPTD